MTTWMLYPAILVFRRRTGLLISAIFECRNSIRRQNRGSCQGIVSLPESTDKIRREYSQWLFTLAGLSVNRFDNQKTGRSPTRRHMLCFERRTLVHASGVEREIITGMDYECGTLRGIQVERRKDSPGAAEPSVGLRNEVRGPGWECAVGCTEARRDLPILENGQAKAHRDFQ